MQNIRFILHVEVVTSIFFSFSRVFFGVFLVIFLWNFGLIVGGFLDEIGGNNERYLAALRPGFRRCTGSQLQLGNNDS